MALFSYTSYAWRIANCQRCSRHVGWKFRATNFKLSPRKFYGITRKSVKSWIVEEESDGEISPDDT